MKLMKKVMKKKGELMINAFSEMFYSPVELFISLTLGFALGSVFFLSLCWVVNKGLTSERPALWFVSGFFIRINLCLLGFYFIADGNWQSLVISLVGFILSRPISKLLIELTSNRVQTKARIRDAS